MIPIRSLLCFGLLAGLAAPAAAQTISLPGPAEVALEEIEALGRYDLPLGPWTEGGMEILRAEGSLLRQVWQVMPFDGSTLELMAPIQAQLEEEGYRILYTCADRACGGFDFRFALDLAPEPAMHVNLGDFTYLTAEKQAGAERYRMSVLASRGGGGGYVHIVRVGPPEAAPIAVTQSSRTPAQPALAGADLAAALTATGRAPLDDLTFETGASTLGDGDYASLADLAAYLAANPAIRIALVGHTDAEGALENNIALGRARADAVRSYLVDRLGVDPGRVRAESVGYLAPRALNTTPDGREMNRRVEVIVTNTE